MKRRTLLAAILTGSASGLAGCASRLGLADRVVVETKAVRGIDGEDEGEDDRLVVERRFDPDTGPVYGGDPPAAVADGFDQTGPLTVDEDLEGGLEGAFRAIRYELRVCASLDEMEGAATDCRETQVLRDDFNEIRVGDTVDVRFGEDVAGVVDVVERRE